MTTRNGRLGVLGGTFDPIHLGHLDAANAARRALALDEVLFIPAHDPPHRPVDPRASAFHRFSLVSLAINGVEGYRASDRELRQDGPSYTALTLRALHAEGWAPSQIFFILGADAFADIGTWFDYPDVLDACHFAVIARPGTTIEQALARTPQLHERARLPGPGRDGDAQPSIFLIHATTRDVSSTDVRARLGARGRADGLLPPPVAWHIRTHHLYEPADDSHGED
jgi:nicotinate-nucleotide adenylyltransferase